MEITPDKRKLVGLVEQAYEGQLCLPNFQRDFVWPRDQVADLIRSVLRRCYIGSLLLLRCDPERPPFAPIHLRGARPAHPEPRPELLILDGLQRYRTEWRDPWTKAVTEFQNFTVPLVELPSVRDSDPESIGRVCAIFEKLNSSGVDLSVYDLLTARLYRSGIRLHNLWHEACQEHERLASWSKGKAETNKFGVLVLRTLALLRGLDPKPSILIDLKPAGFQEDWKRATAAIERALELIEHVGPDGFGVFDRKWLPGFGLVPILAALRAVVEDRELGERPRSDLRRWYWCNVFLERYSSGVESKSRKDFAEMVAHWTEGQPEPAVFAEARSRISAEGYSVRESASYASTVYSGIFCLLALRGARDWVRGESIELQKLHDHHIFPKAYLKRHGLTKRSEVNSVVNRTLISDKTNGKVKDRAPAEYLTNREIFPSGATSELLRPHFLADAALAALQAAAEGDDPNEVSARYEAFRTAREAAIIEEIRSVCGVVPGTRKVLP